MSWKFENSRCSCSKHDIMNEGIQILTEVLTTCKLQHRNVIDNVHNIQRIPNKLDSYEISNTCKVTMLQSWTKLFKHGRSSDTKLQLVQTRASSLANSYLDNSYMENRQIGHIASYMLADLAFSTMTMWEIISYLNKITPFKAQIGLHKRTSNADRFERDAQSIRYAY